MNVAHVSLSHQTSFTQGNGSELVHIFRLERNVDEARVECILLRSCLGGRGELLPWNEIISLSQFFLTHTCLSLGMSGEIALSLLPMLLPITLLPLFLPMMATRMAHSRHAIICVHLRRRLSVLWLTNDTTVRKRTDRIVIGRRSHLLIVHRVCLRLTILTAQSWKRSFWNKKSAWDSPKYDSRRRYCRCRWQRYSGNSRESSRLTRKSSWSTGNDGFFSLQSRLIERDDRRRRSIQLTITQRTHTRIGRDWNEMVMIVEEKEMAHSDLAQRHPAAEGMDWRGSWIFSDSSEGEEREREDEGVGCCYERGEGMVERGRWWEQREEGLSCLQRWWEALNLREELPERSILHFWEFEVSHLIFIIQLIII